ncbi:MAG: alanine dehydrogenase [Paracoccaceae bacterium]|nr:alanine dehydrogenase [Paracoccaceae bacterium]
MLVGCPKEIKNHEYRVGLTPSIVKSLVIDKHDVIIEQNAGVGSGFSDDNYIEAGARIVTSTEIFSDAEMIVKVKEPQQSERANLNSGQLIFTYLHLASDKDQTSELINSKATAIAYETITDTDGTLPLLAPMSEIAGRLAPQMGAWALQKANGGSGKLLAGAPGVIPVTVLIIGGGVVGTQAALIASGMGATVTLMDNSIKRLKYLDEIFHSRFNTNFSSEETIEKAIKSADMIIGAVLVPGAEAPKLVSRSQLSLIKKRSVLVDVAIDQGGCFETSSATTHDNPIYNVDDIIHYCVANMPGAVPNTSTLALSHATKPFIRELANKGWKKACSENQHLLNGLNIHDGNVTNRAVAKAQNLNFVDPKTLLDS